MNAMMPISDSQELRNAFACFPTGVTALCALIDGRPVGMAASSFTSVSLEPPLVSICVQTGSATWRMLASSPLLGVSFLGEGHDLTCRRLAAKTVDRFAGIDWEAAPTGAVFIEAASVWLECAVYQRIPAGDHELVLLRIERLRIEPDINPLVFHASRFRQLSGA